MGASDKKWQEHDGESYFDPDPRNRGSEGGKWKSEPPGEEEEEMKWTGKHSRRRRRRSPHTPPLPLLSLAFLLLLHPLCSLQTRAKGEFSKSRCPKIERKKVGGKISISVFLLSRTKIEPQGDDFISGGAPSPMRMTQQKEEGEAFGQGQGPPGTVVDDQVLKRSKSSSNKKLRLSET